MSDQLLLHKGKAHLRTEEGKQLERPETLLVEMLKSEFLPPLGSHSLPDGVKFYDWRPPFLIVVHQTPPHVRQLRWIAPNSPAPFGPNVLYRKVRLSLPYALTFAIYARQGDRLFVHHACELYFRNEPLRTREDRLGYPALLNLSRIRVHSREKAWICTQYLRCPPEADWPAQLQLLLEHTWNGGFNLSSENHEGASWFGLSQGIHPDLHPVERWEQASSANDAFALTVPWKPVPQTVGEIVECMFAETQKGPRSQTLDLPGRFLNFAQKHPAR